jgi:hypothetical protein
VEHPRALVQHQRTRAELRRLCDIFLNGATENFAGMRKQGGRRSPATGSGS